jgi:purine-nucleoside phosphorylase
MKIINLLTLVCLSFCSTLLAGSLTDPVVTAEKYVEYKKKNGHLKDFIAPKIVLVCYQQGTLNHLLELNPKITPLKSFDNLYLVDDGRVGILGGWGMGSPTLAVKMEQLIALGVKQFVAIGTAGALTERYKIGDYIIATKALAEDGVAHLYLNGEKHATVDEKLLSKWKQFSINHALPQFHMTGTWSFSAIFKETPADIIRVTKEGYDVVEMEAATLYAIGHEKGAQTLTMFVISDTISMKEWTPRLKEPCVNNNLYKLSEWALEFCDEITKADTEHET